MEDQIEVQVWKNENAGAVIAGASVVVPTAWGDITLERLRVIQKDGQSAWVALPQASYVKNGKTHYQNIIQIPIRLKRQIEAKILNELGLGAGK